MPRPPAVCSPHRASLWPACRYIPGPKQALELDVGGFMLREILAFLLATPVQVLAAVCGVRCAVCGVRGAGCGVRGAGCGVRGGVCSARCFLLCGLPWFTPGALSS